MHYIRICLHLGFLLTSNAAVAAEIATTTSAGTSEVTTASHFGFGMADQSSTGFKNVGGSLVFFDITKPADQGIDFGIRSIAEGGHGGTHPGAAFYRLGTGPLMSVRIGDIWVLQTALSYFNETALAATGERLYTSRGTAASIGWERIIHVGHKLEVAYGGYVSHYQGSLSTPGKGTTASVQLVPSLAGAGNTGLNHGLELALRLAL